MAMQESNSIYKTHKCVTDGNQIQKEVHTRVYLKNLKWQSSCYQMHSLDLYGRKEKKKKLLE